MVDAFLGDHAEVGGQQGQGDGQQVWLSAQSVAEHPIGYKAHEVNLRGQSEQGEDPKSCCADVSDHRLSSTIKEKVRCTFLPCVCLLAGLSYTSLPFASGKSQTLPSSSFWPIRNKDYCIRVQQRHKCLLSNLQEWKQYSLWTNL